MSALIRSQRRAAQEPQERQAAKGQQYLTFSVTGELFGIAIVSIKEIIEYRATTEVPMMPAFMRGIINLRGRVVPVIDLAVRFGRARSEVTARSCIVIVEAEQGGEQHDLGVVVDAVSAVADIADADIEPPPSFGARLRSDFITGMGKINERFVILLDVSRVLSIEELSVLGDIAQERTAGDLPAPGAASGQ
jgi:purine-binding chemotaxis protein CheW